MLEKPAFGTFNYANCEIYSYKITQLLPKFALAESSNLGYNEKLDNIGLYWIKKMHNLWNNIPFLRIITILFASLGKLEI